MPAHLGTYFIDCLKQVVQIGDIKDFNPMQMDDLNPSVPFQGLVEGTARQNYQSLPTTTRPSFSSLEVGGHCGVYGTWFIILPYRVC